MKPEAQRIAIAEACGLTVIEGTLCAPKPEVRHGSQTGDVDINPVAPLPDYLNDLNAMHEAENLLGDEDFNRYVFRLQGLYIEKTKGRTDAGCVSAPARERAEAFLRTIGKWDESK